MNKILYTLMFVVLAGCSSLEKDRQFAQSIATSGQLSAVSYATKTFNIQGWQTPLKARQPITIYLEGDGMAWLSRNQISPDPTPNDPIALSLATIEAQYNPKANIVYLSRPCQYTTRAQNPQCNSRYWGKARYAPEVLHSYADIINQLKAQYHPTELHLVGYSGGAAIAMWLATQSADIRSVTTVAGNVDPKAFSRLHCVDDLTESVDVSAALTTMPAIAHHHYVGALDNTVPMNIAQSMMRLLPESTKQCGQITVVEGVSHTSGWEAYWNKRLSSSIQAIN